MRDEDEREDEVEGEKHAHKHDEHEGAGNEVADTYDESNKSFSVDHVDDERRYAYTPIFSRNLRQYFHATFPSHGAMTST